MDFAAKGNGRLAATHRGLALGDVWLGKDGWRARRRGSRAGLTERFGSQAEAAEALAAFVVGSPTGRLTRRAPT